MNRELLVTYRKFRQHSPFMVVGHNARMALDAARTLLRFRELEDRGLVRLRCEPELENYFDVFGEPEPERNGHRISQDAANKELEAVLERYGVWWTCSEYFDGQAWQHADSCGMHTGYKDASCPFENCYIIDEMAEAVRLAEDQLELEAAGFEPCPAI